MKVISMLMPVDVHIFDNGLTTVHVYPGEVQNGQVFLDTPTGPERLDEDAWELLDMQNWDDCFHWIVK